jgi:Ca2+-binding RTX toxin-like protein
VYGTNNSETINAFDGVTNGADTIYGFGGNDTISGLGGNDEIKGGGGADAINGGSGIDTANYSDSSEGVLVSLASGLGFGGTAEGDTLTNVENLTGSSHDDWLVGNGSSNVLTGLEGNDILDGGDGADTLYGDSGNDTLKGGGGADTLNGGSGIDTANYNGSDAGVFVSLYHDTASGGDAAGDELNSIENLTGSAHDDVLWGNDGANVLKGQAGDDTLKGYGGADTLWGGDGADYLDGGTGIDTMFGGQGNDSYVVDNAGDVVSESSGEGTDLVRTSINYTLGANVENLSTTSASGTSALSLTGNSLANTITGNDGDNAINGGGGGDTMIGNGGDDIYTVDSFGDTVVEAAADGNDTVYALVNGYTLGANVENLSLNAGTALSGFGNALDNELYGNALDNVLDGGAGADDLSGLGGNDTFSFVAGQAQSDTVWDFTGNGAGVGDLLKFDGYGTLAEGASFTDLGGNQYEVTSADGLISETLTIYGAVNVNDLVFV